MAGHRDAGEAPDAERARSRLVALVTLLALLGLTVLLASEAAHEGATGWIHRLAPYIEKHAVLGAAVFMVLSAASAMLAFFSSAVLVPVAIAAWGEPSTFVLLWSGWLLGGVLSYAIGRGVGGAILAGLVPRQKLAQYESRVERNAPIWAIVLLQLSLPSEIPGYLLGSLRYRFHGYLIAVSIAELPWAALTVYLGERFLERDVAPLIAGAAASALLLVVVGQLARRRLRHHGNPLPRAR